MRERRCFGTFLRPLRDDHAVVSLAIRRERLCVIARVHIEGKVSLAAYIEIGWLGQTGQRRQVVDQPGRQMQLIKKFDSARPP